MYFDFEDYHPDISPVGRAISWREGILISIIVHLAMVIVLLLYPRFFPYDPAAARVTAWDLADALASGHPPVIVRDHEIERGFFELDPCNLHDGEASIVADRIAEELDTARKRNVPSGRSAAERKTARFERLLRWPD